MENATHLAAIELRLSHERVRLANAKTKGERELRAVWVAGIEKELADERKFLGIADAAIESDTNMSDEELLAALGL